MRKIIPKTLNELSYTGIIASSQGIRRTPLINYKMLKVLHQVLYEIHPASARPCLAFAGMHFIRP